MLKGHAVLHVASARADDPGPLEEVYRPTYFNNATRDSYWGATYDEGTSTVSYSRRR